MDDRHFASRVPPPTLVPEPASEEALSAFVPDWVLQSLAQGAGEPGPKAQARPAAVLLLDFAGYSTLSDRHAREGLRGTEALSAHLDRSFGPIIRTILRHGGDIAAFLGDGLIAIWRDTEGDGVAATLGAAECALGLQHLAPPSPEAAPARGEPLLEPMRYRVAVDYGLLHFCKAGGVGGRWLYFLAGQPIAEVGHAYRGMEAGRVRMCTGAWRILASRCATLPGAGCERDLLALHSTSPLLPTPCNRRRAAPLREPRVVSRASFEQQAQYGVFLQRGVHPAEWPGEFRRMTLLRLCFPDGGFEGQAFARLQAGLAAMQGAVDHLGGLIFQVAMDDKGLCATLVFGMPFLAHEDDALRAVRAATTIRERLRALDVPVSIGIASGRIFFGECGVTERREFLLGGYATVLATRLMEEAGGEIFCDADTAQATAGRVAFTVLPPRSFKGCEAPCPVYQPLELAVAPSHPFATPIVGREKEREVLAHRLDAASRGQGGVIVLCGESGIGKSRLLADAAVSAREQGLRVLRGAGNGIERSTPYYAWRAVLARLLDAGEGRDPEWPRRRARELLREDQATSAWLPLLNDILPLRFRRTELSLQISGAARAASIEEVVVALLRGSCEESPTVMLVDDLHWLDDASADLLGAAARRLPGLLVVAGTRPAAAARINAADLALRNGGATELRLGALAPPQMAELLRNRLKVAAIPDHVLHFVHAKGDGNPLHCEELALALRDNGRLVIERDRCHAAEELEDPRNAFVARGLQGVIVERIDQLRPIEQLALKMASALGRSFSLESLTAIFPEPWRPRDLRAVLDHLAAQELLAVELAADGTGETYVFRHALSQEATYELLPFAQRRSLHRRIARHLEARHANALDSVYGPLATHWELAEDAAQALRYLELAGQQSLHSYANRDAIRYGRRLLEVADRHAVQVEASVRARWHLLMADAHHELAEFEEAARQYHAAMQAIGRPIPVDRAELLRGLTGMTLMQLALRFHLRTPGKATTARREAAQLAAHAYERLSEGYFFRNDALAVQHGTLASINLAELGCARAETIHGFGALAIGLGTAGMVRTARYYSRASLRMAEAQGQLPEIARANLVAAVLEYGLGNWTSFADRAARARELYRRLGDRARWQNVQAIDTFVAILLGDLPRARLLLDEMAATLSERGTGQARAWYLAARTLVDRARGEVDADILGELRELANQVSLRADRQLCLGVAALGYLGRGEIQVAQGMGELALATLEGCSFVWGGWVYGAAGAAEPCLALWEAGTRSLPAPAAVIAGARRASALLSRFARRSPVCVPRALLLRGRILALTGQRHRALLALHHALSAAERLNLQHEAALIRLASWRCHDMGSRQGQTDLQQATQALERIGARGDLPRHAAS